MPPPTVDAADSRRRRYLHVFRCCVVVPTNDFTHMLCILSPSFYLALSRGENDEKNVEGVIWMSARAAHTPIIKFFGGEIDNSHPIGRALVTEGRRQGVRGFGTKGGLYGKFRHNIHFSRESRNALKGEHKFHNFVEYMRMTPFIKKKKSKPNMMSSLDPPSMMSRTTSGIALEEMIRNDKSRATRFFSCDVCECQVNAGDNTTPTGPYIFLGDNGEGDEVTAIRLLLAHPDRVGACFIHDVTGRGFGRNQHARNLVEKRKLFYFKTYLGAALQAFEVGLISKKSVNRIRQAILQSPHTQIARRIWVFRKQQTDENLRLLPQLSITFTVTSRRRTKRRLILSDRILRCGVRKFVRTWKHMIL